MDETTAADMVTRRPVAAAFLDVLAQEGYRPKVDRALDDENASCVVLDSEGTTFFVFA